MISAGLNAAYYSDPTWGNHGLIFKNAGFKDVKKYRYYDSKKNSLDIEGFLADLESAPARYLNKTKKGRILEFESNKEEEEDDGVVNTYSNS